VTVNCAAIPRELFEGELFGHEKGAYTGAHDARPGLVSCAHGGTLFLDEVGDLSLENQARILRVVEYGVFRAVGASTETRVNLRVVAATNRDIEAAIKSGGFRVDLYHRLNGFEIHIPPLRERASDIAPLAEHFFQIGKGEAKRTLAGIAPEALDHLRSRPWPGNVRELRNCILRAIATARHDAIALGDVLDRVPRGPVGPVQPSLSLVEAEKTHIGATLRKCNGNIREAAKILQVSPSTLYRKITQYGIE
jgi:DNA-binding NtrC family response regulator